MVAIVIVKNMHISIRSSNVQVTTQDEGIIDFQPGFDNAAQSAIVTGIVSTAQRCSWDQVVQGSSPVPSRPDI